jgi:primosomal replication protein N
MINEVILEGIVVREPWKYIEDLFFRIVVYRDHDLPSKKMDEERDAGDYINIRMPGAASGLIHIHKGMKLRVHGFLQSRDYRESLQAFIDKAKKGQTNKGLEIKVEGETLQLHQIMVDRNLVEIICNRIYVLDDGKSKTYRRSKSPITIHDLENRTESNGAEMDWQDEDRNA